MTKFFSSPMKFAEHLMKVATVELKAIEKGLHVASQIIQSEAQKEIGNLQSALGPFNEWKELAESTKADKERLGYVFNKDYNPLLREGDLRQSIGFNVNMEKLEAIIGSKDPIAAFQEYGTHRIPPRPFIGRSAFKSKDTIIKIFGAAATAGIIDGNKIQESIERVVGSNQDIEL